MAATSTSVALRLPDSNRDILLGDQPGTWAACSPVSPACSTARRSPSPSSRLRIVGSRSRIKTSLADSSGPYDHEPQRHIDMCDSPPNGCIACHWGN
jgi:hypothetical protein